MPLIWASQPPPNKFTLISSTVHDGPFMETSHMWPTKWPCDFRDFSQAPESACKFWRTNSSGSSSLTRPCKKRTWKYSKREMIKQKIEIVIIAAIARAYNQFHGSHIVALLRATVFWTSPRGLQIFPPSRAPSNACGTWPRAWRHLAPVIRWLMMVCRENMWSTEAITMA